MSLKGYEELSVLNRKLDDLLTRYENLKEENREFRIENERLKGMILENEGKIKELEKKYDRVKLSGALLGGGENAVEAKRKINELVREIDRCVALINR